MRAAVSLTNLGTHPVPAVPSLKVMQQKIFPGILLHEADWGYLATEQAASVSGFSRMCPDVWSGACVPLDWGLQICDMVAVAGIMNVTFSRAPA